MDKDANFRYVEAITEVLKSLIFRDCLLKMLFSPC